MPKQPPLTIAELLYRARQITQDQLARAVGSSAATSAPLSATLVQTGAVSPEDVRTVSLALSLLLERLIPEDITVEAIARCVGEKVNLELALENLGWRLDYKLVTGRLCQILVESGTVSAADLSSAVEASNASGLPLGRVLVVRKVVPEAHAYAALTAQVLIKEGRISAQQAIDGLKLAYSERITIEEALAKIGAVTSERREPVRLGQLLVSAGLLSEMDLLSAVEKGMAEEIPLGQVLLNQGLVPSVVLDKALALQSKINELSISPAEAILELQNADRIGDHSKPVEPQIASDSYAEQIDLPDSVKVFGIYTKDDWFRTVQELTLEKQNLAYKVVSQQEEMKFRLAREMHDTIIADLMMLKRYLDGDREMSKSDIVEIVDHVVLQLRDICSDFAPRHFKEWGLEMTVKDMLNRMSERTGMKVDFVCDVDVPSLPDPVGLHIFRIIQEGINNIEKYSGASAVSLVVDRPKKKALRFTLSDNGKGMIDGDEEKPRTDGGGMGMGGMRERADLIRCFYPAKLSMESGEGKGVTISLELEL